jgi:hypothetical protein
MQSDDDAIVSSLSVVGDLYADLYAMQTSNTFLDSMRQHLAEVSSRRRALILLLLVDVSTTCTLAPELVELSVSHANADIIRQILGRVARSELEEVIGPIVNNRLGQADDDEYRRLAELLDHLGMGKSLALLVTSANRSADPDIREVGEDFARSSLRE